MVEDQIECLGDFAAGVAVELNHGSCRALVLGPCPHDGTIVDSIDSHVLNSVFLQLILLCQISRDLPCGSGGGECPRKTHDRKLLVGLAQLAQWDLLWRKAEIEANIWEFVSDLDSTCQPDRTSERPQHSSHRCITKRDQFSGHLRI
eukprot:TRINITY_DN81112_c0_g1_i1.p1 TRINITY_DN81112_c0_g1~~TRINITY_DN81112_c0_g1_i1.p1  ORF type:complete len:147 (+),score=9.01 TRINITY_DN81112_c0_g1_i1:464-904(+)